jgi:hypothetical protein
MPSVRELAQALAVNPAIATGGRHQPSPRVRTSYSLKRQR